jgi:hypoxanthine phosphoribosyltransferase
MSDRVEVYISEEEIKNKVKELGEMITRDYKGRDTNLLLISILKGSVVFLSDLIRAVDVPLAIDFMIISSYGAGTQSKGNVKIIKDLDINISDYDLLIVEDILDSGYTLSKVIEMLKTRKPKSLKICAFLDKPERRIAPVKLDYTGFTIKDEFVVGYGLDYNERYRNLPYVGILSLDK